jgi:hypothetical protein
MKIKNLYINKIIVCTALSASLVVTTSLLTSCASVVQSNQNHEQSNSKPAYVYEQIDEFKKQSIEKLAAEIESVGSSFLDKSSTEVNSIIEKQLSIYNKNTNLSNFIKDLTAPTQDELSNAYNAIAKENQKLQLDVTDWYDFNHNTISRLSKQLNQDLANQSYSKTKAEHISDEMQNFLKGSISSFGEKYYYSPFDAASDIVLNFTSNYVTNNVSKTDKLLAIANDYLKTHQESLFFANDGFDISNLLAVYSGNGELGYNLKDEIKLSDLSSFFKYSYDPTYGSILTKPEINYDSISDTNDDYNFSLRITEPLKAHTFHNGSTYYDGEFLPGYTLHARIVSLDADTDSHKCTIKFQFGVQSTIHDPYGEHVL